MINMFSEYFFGSGSSGVPSDPVEMKAMGDNLEQTVTGVTSPDDPLSGLKNPSTSPSLGVTQSVTYIDFFPQCLNFNPTEGHAEFDPFSTVIEAANQWLSANPVFRLLKCESIRKKILDGPKIEFDSVLHHESSNGKNYFLNGLRLWLRGRQPCDTESSQQIGCRHSVPWMAVDGDTDQTTTCRLYPDKFLSLQQKIESLNTSLKRKPLPGSILTVESVCLRSSDPLELPGWSPERSCWLEDATQPIHSVTIFRLFYVLGEPTLEVVGVQDFLPKVTKEAMSFASKPHFQPFSEVVKTANCWLQQNKGVRVVNMQSSVTKMEQKNTGKATALRNLLVFTETHRDVTLYLKLLTVFHVTKLKAEKLTRIDVKTLNVTPSSDPVNNTSTSQAPSVHKPQTINYTECETSAQETMTSSHEAMTSSQEAMTSSQEAMTSSSPDVTSQAEKSQNTVASPAVDCFPSTVDIPCLTCKLFSPLRRGPKSFESFSRTVDRASYWIKCNKSPLLFLESTQSLFSENMYGTGVKEEMVLCEINRQVGRYYLTSVWGYFADKTEELVMEQMSNPYVKIEDVSDERVESGVV